MKIKELELFTSKLEEQKKFYSQTLGLSILDSSDNFVSFQIGHSILKLTYREKNSPYHFAINIPSNQEVEALAWLKNRVEILTYENKEIQYFDFWDANAIYFYDTENNIVELIARNTLKNQSNQPFSKDSMLEISEIGLPTFDIEKVYKTLNKSTGIPIYSGNLERFCTFGDEHGLFIVVNKDLKKEWFPTKDEPICSDFIIRFIEKGKDFAFEYKDEKLQELANKV